MGCRFWLPIVTDFHKSSYLLRLLMVVIGCFIIACSVILQLKANVINNTAEGVVKAIAIKQKPLLVRLKFVLMSA